MECDVQIEAFAVSVPLVIAKTGVMNPFEYLLPAYRWNVVWPMRNAVSEQMENLSAKNR